MPYRLFALFVFLLCSFYALAQEDADFQTIRRAIAEQQEAWNRGDIPAFMQAYWRSDELQFIGGSGVTKGWQATLDNYYRRYPDRAAMGQLTFGIVSMEKISSKCVFLVGTWDLKRQNDAPGGHFVLIWKKIKGKWLITADHTSSR
jgi:ketosteroid isomerase-like protein